MHLDDIFLDTFIDKEVRHLGALISLKLYDLACLLIVDDCAVAGEFLITIV